MTDLVVRRLLIDLESPLARHWCGGDPFLTALFNALSMSFPVGEQFFIDSVREGARQLLPAAAASLRDDVQGFIGQEATHRRLHTLFNAHLDAHGLVNSWGPRAKRRQQLLAGKDVRHHLAVTAAFEHFTAILADWLLGQPEVLQGAEPRLQTLWFWHSAEESEHKTTAFNVYQALGGDEAWRRRWFRRITMVFLVNAAHQTLSNLWRDGSFWRSATWASAWRHLFGARGLVTLTRTPWRDYLKTGFHPSQHHSALAQEWLSRNAALYTPLPSPL